MKHKLISRWFSAGHDIAFALLFLASAGCGDRALKLTASENQAFATASADIKQRWEKALAADKARDYSTAQTLLDELSQLTLSADQKSALEKQRADFGQRVWAAAEKNDPAAIKAVQDSQKSSGRGRALPAR